MLISMNWIFEFTDLNDVNQRDLINRFTLSTAEVEEVYELGNDIKDVVVGEIVEVKPHPGSQKLHLLTLNIGTELVPCVCGACNVFPGAKVTFAKAGGMLKGKNINKTSIAGFHSCGMCCSEKELGISEENSGLLILPSTW